MAKFGIRDLMEIKKEISRAEMAREYREIWLDPREVKPSESNFYSQEKIEELADSFLMVGQQQPTVLARAGGEFFIVSGHRRNLANIRNLERGYSEYGKVRYLYRDMTPAMLELSLLMGNAYNRELTGWEKSQQAKRLKEALIRAKKEDGLKIPGKLRDVVAGLMNESSSNIARMECINKHASVEINEEFKKGNLGISAAYEASKLPQEEQKEIAKQVSDEGGIRAKEIAEKRKEKKGRAFAAVPDSDTGLQGQDGGVKQTGEEPACQNGEAGKGRGRRPTKRISRHQAILREWRTECTGRAAHTQAVADAVQRVSESDTSRTEWSDVEWAVYLAGAIMDKADCVSEEDLYLLHDIWLRCKTGR